MFRKNFLVFPLPVSLSEKVASDDLPHSSAVIGAVLFQMHSTAVTARATRNEHVICSRHFK